MSSPLKPLKKLGQHFLVNDVIASDIASAIKLSNQDYNTLIEIGPGTGVLTYHLQKLKLCDFYAVEIDSRSVEYLQKIFPSISKNIIEGDFLKIDLDFIKDKQYGIIGNFPYNISSQILFKVYENWEQIPELVGMFQDEVAKRLCSPPGNKNYGILSVLLQAYYKMEYLFQVTPEHFNPRPKVNSAVIRMQRKTDAGPDCDPKKFKMIIKAAFNQRRKTLRNSLKSFSREGIPTMPYSDKRPEQLSHIQFAEIVNALF